MPATPSQGLRPEAEEAILCRDKEIHCETYIFEPSPGEEKLGYLFAAGEIENRHGIGPELLDTVITAIQKEYYRDSSRLPSSSFEMALHQANLILHDTAEQGIRDWMGHFHVAIGILSASALHISVAGEGRIVLVRNSQVTDIAEGLAFSPITNALQTFSQVASGDVTARDILFFTTSNFPSVFNPSDITRFTLEHSAATISTRLKELYKDQAEHAPLSFVTVSLLPQYIAAAAGSPAAAEAAVKRKTSGLYKESLKPRQPIVMHKSGVRRFLSLTGRLFASIWALCRQYIWPHVKTVSHKGGRAILSSAQTAGRSAHSLVVRHPGDTTSTAAMPRASLVERVRSTLFSLPSRTLAWIQDMPRSGKIFGLISLLLVVALVSSLVLLRHKRAEDSDIQRASELLHEARTKKDAAETALIYDNRDQAQGLLKEAEDIMNQLQATGLYVEETKQLHSDITAQVDRLQRITRITAEQGKVLADLSSHISGQTPQQIFFIDDALYTYNPANNAIIKIKLDGSVETARETTQNIGFIINGDIHPADKTILFQTDPVGLALFDSKDNSLNSQEIQFATSKPVITDISLFGNRLYVYDTSGKNIYSYAKSLRGYSGGTPWITGSNVPKEGIVSLAVDGSIFALYDDGTVRRLFKGEIDDFAQQEVSPSLADATNIITTENFTYVYVVDPANKRLVIYNKQGLLIQQVIIDAATTVDGVVIHPDETKIYILDGKRILEGALASQAQATE